MSRSQHCPECERLTVELLRANADIANCCDKRDDITAERDRYERQADEIHAAYVALQRQVEAMQAAIEKHKASNTILSLTNLDLWSAVDTYRAQQEADNE